MLLRVVSRSGKELVPGGLDVKVRAAARRAAFLHKTVVMAAARSHSALA
jgi:hypothetical protein